MRKQYVFILIAALAVLAVLSALLIVSRTQSDTSSYEKGCADERQALIDELGGPKKAAQYGVSSTLEGCSNE